jgi:nickel-dependent lactate racemase
VTARIGRPHEVLVDDEIDAFVRARMDELDLDDRSLCLVIPDATRKCPLPQLIRAIREATAGRVRSCTAVVALGTHAPMTEEARHG